MTEFKSREEKIDFLKGIQNGTRSINELQAPFFTWLEYRDEDLNAVYSDGGKAITRERARQIRNRNNQKLMIFINGEPGGNAQKMYEEDTAADIDAKEGLNFIFRLTPGCEPLKDEDSPK